MAVRRERVVLELEDRFTPGIFAAAAATRVLDKELDSLSKDAVQSKRATRDLDTETAKLGGTARRTASDLDRMSGRMRILLDVATMLGPALVPIGAVGIPALTGLASALGFTTLAAGSTAIAFQGVGEALDAVNKARLEPTAANLDKARAAMARLSPEARGFVRQIQQMIPALRELRDSAAAGLFPGLDRGLEDLQRALPRVQLVVAALADAAGDIAADAGASLGSGDWDEFFDFIGSEGPSALSAFARALGNTAHAGANLWMALDPLNDDFLGWLVGATADLEAWADGLDQTDGFREFVDYIRANGPQVADTLAAVGDALLQIVQAAAPLGGPVLRVIESFADAIATIADSPAGTPIMAMVTAMSALSTATRIQNALQDRTWGGQNMVKMRAAVAALGTVTTAQDRARMSADQLVAAEARRAKAISTGVRAAGRSATTLGLLGVAATGVADNFGLANTASLAMAGSLAGPWGAAIGGGVGLVLDFMSAHKQSDEAIQAFMATLNQETGALTESSRQFAANSLLQAGVLEDAQALGVSLSGVTDAALGQAGAMEALNAQLDAIIRGGTTRTSSGQDVLTDRAQAASDLANALVDTNGVVQEGAWRQKLLTDAIAQTIAPTQEQTRVTERQARALQLSREAAREGGRQFITLGDSLDNAKVSLAGWLRELEKQADALVNFANNAKTAADKGLAQGLVRELEKAGPAGALRMKQLADGTEAEIERANRAWRRGQQAIRDFEAMRITPKQIDIRDQRGLAAIERIKAALAQIPRSLRTDYYVNQVNSINKGRPGKGGTDRDPTTPQADGGTVPKTGRPYADRHPYLLADGEEVISNRRGQADRHRGLLKLINAGALADGGTTGRRPPLAGYITGELGMSFPNTIREWERALRRSEKTIDRERSQRDELVSKRNDLVASVAGKLRSDLFTTDTSSSVWMSAADRAKAGVGDVFSTLTGDITNATAFQNALKALKAKGLDGAAFEEVARNADLAQAQALASSSSAEIQRYESLFNQRDRALASVGSYAGTAVYGAAITAQTKHLAQIEAANKRLEKKVDQLRNDLPAAAEKAGREFAKGIRAVAPKRG